MAEFRTVAKLAEVPPGTLKQIMPDVDTQICLANVDGMFYAINGECTHMGGPLGEGELDGTTVTCPWHGGEFNVTTGELVGGPPDDPVAAYQVRVEGDEVQVALE